MSTLTSSAVVKKSRRKLTPALMVAGSFFFAVIIGTLLLKIPACSVNSITWLQSFFTATSAICVTGLIVVDTAKDFTPFGQIVILSLIQLGGLGILTLSTLFLSIMGGRVSIRGRKLMEETLSQMPFKHTLMLLAYIVGVTLFIEGVGAYALYADVKDMAGVDHPLFFSIFHSVSAYCNAGFSLQTDSFSSYNTMSWINMVLTFLIILGGIGFVVMMEIQAWCWNRFRGRRSYLSLYTKFVLRTSLILLLTGTVVILALEWNNALSELPLVDKVMNAWFVSVNARTAGFNMIAVDHLTSGTMLFVILLMIIGGSPASTAGGVKTTTVAVIFSALRSRMHDREHVEVMGRTLPRETVTRAVATLFMAFTGLVITLLLILVIEEGATPAHENPPGFFIDHLFEVTSALGTVGMSTGVTRKLHPFSQLLITICMFAGRVGPLTLAVSLFTSSQPVRLYKFPEESVPVG